MEPVKLTPGVRALLHFFSRCSHDVDTGHEWDGYSIAMLEKEATLWHEANEGFARERLHFAGDYFFAYKGAHILHFGAYGDHHVLAFGCLEDALEEAAHTLSPGFFTTPDYKEAAEELGIPWPMNDYTHEDVMSQLHEHAEADLTYTEAGWLISHEWGASCDLSPDDVISYIYAGEPAK